MEKVFLTENFGESEFIADYKIPTSFFYSSPNVLSLYYKIRQPESYWLNTEQNLYLNEIADDLVKVVNGSSIIELGGFESKELEAVLKKISSPSKYYNIDISESALKNLN